MIFLDANVITKAFVENPDKDKCRVLIEGDFLTDSLCLVEAQDSITLIKKDKIYAGKSIKSLFKRNVTIVPVGMNVIFESLARLEKYDLNIFDLVHYTVALLNNCSEFVSYDRDFDGLEIKRVEP